MPTVSQVAIRGGLSRDRSPAMSAYLVLYAHVACKEVKKRANCPNASHRAFGSVSHRTHVEPPSLRFVFLGSHVQHLHATSKAQGKVPFGK